jgi:hypothetical protein
MTRDDFRKQLYMDEITYVSNPYFYVKDYEDKGVFVLIKKTKDADISYIDLKEVCFECPDMEVHEGIIKMVLFHVNQNNEIYKYTIAASKEKVMRDDTIKYEQYVGMKVE